MSELENQNTGFSESWLSLREPADHAARNTALVTQLVQWRARRQQHLHIIEIGAGTGSNLRFLLPKLGHHQHWLLVDYDATLLEHLPRILKPWTDSQKAQLTISDDQLRIEHDEFSAIVEWQVIDLSSDLEKLQSQRTDLLLGSALLDLTSAHWLDSLAKLCIEKQCTCLFALNYDGRVKWQPELDSDKRINQLLNTHQLNDKGFGKALGPTAGMYFANRLEQWGREVLTHRSDWQISSTTISESAALQHAIIDGWAPAAIEQSSSEQTMIKQWQHERREFIDKGESELMVGHLEVLSLT